MKMTSVEPYMVQKKSLEFSGLFRKSPSFTISHMLCNQAEAGKMHLKQLYDHACTINMQVVWGSTCYQILLS